MRLFLALELPAAARSAIDEACAAVRSHLPTARWVRPANLHLTFAFLGEVEESSIPLLDRRLRERLEQGIGFSGRLSGVGAFPPAGKVRVLWIGLEPHGALEETARLVRQGLTEARVPFDAKPFRAHITVARCDPPWSPATRAELERRFAPFTELLSRTVVPCERVTLFSSVLGKGGPTHRAELEVALRSPSGAAAGVA